MWPNSQDSSKLYKKTTAGITALYPEHTRIRKDIGRPLFSLRTVLPAECPLRILNPAKKPARPG
jgi:hypothetical protein